MIKGYCRWHDLKYDNVYWEQCPYCEFDFPIQEQKTNWYFIDKINKLALTASELHLAFKRIGNALRPFSNIISTPTEIRMIKSVRSFLNRFENDGIVKNMHVVLDQIEEYILEIRIVVIPGIKRATTKRKPHKTFAFVEEWFDKMPRVNAYLWIMRLPWKLFCLYCTGYWIVNVFIKGCTS